MKEILDKLLKITNEELDGLETRFISPYNFYHDVSYFHGVSGREHYRLLMYVATLFKNQTLCDLGTNRCMSAAALSFEYRNNITSYDIIALHAMNPIIPKVEWIIGDIREDSRLIDMPFIFMDVDHDGLFENIFYDYLHKIGWKGLLMLDDIKLNEPMKTFWNRIEEEKYDLTSRGHWSGTGLAVFE